MRDFRKNGGPFVIGLRIFVLNFLFCRDIIIYQQIRIKKENCFLKRIITKVFPQTIPVMVGYLSLGIAFGLLLQSIGYEPLRALLMSLFIYAGSAQFLAVELLAAGATLAQVALLTFLLNFRHRCQHASVYDICTERSSVTQSAQRRINMIYK